MSGRTRRLTAQRLMGVRWKVKESKSCVSVVADISKSWAGRKQICSISYYYFYDEEDKDALRLLAGQIVSDHNKMLKIGGEK